VTVETGKASGDIEAEMSGFLHILLQEGAKAMVGTAVGLIAETEPELERLQKA
jgi:pyruvate/2-oxoglutarate dehydrogenase complex dihydrolipoamide acyltransferase (E2) component